MFTDSSKSSPSRLPLQYFLSERGQSAERITENSFTPWFKLIARDLLYPWWDEMTAKSKAEGSEVVRAGVLEGGDKVNELIKMV